MNKAERKELLKLAEKLYLSLFDKQIDRTYHFVAHLQKNGMMVSVTLDPLATGRLKRLVEDRFGASCCDMTDDEYEAFVAFRYNSKLTTPTERR